MAQVLKAMSDTDNVCVPFSDIAAQNTSIKVELDKAVSRVVRNSAFVLGQEVEVFESAFAEFCESAYSVGCNSGTSAIHLALQALDIGPGDEVITVSHTFIGSVWGIVYCGATPVFVDIEADTMLMDVARVEACITERTKAILPVHLYGHPVDMDPLLEIAKRHGLYVIEDAAQAHGARYKGRRVGSLGDIACFSFYPGKNLGAWGEAGAAVTKSPELALRMRQLRDHAQLQRYQHGEIGFNYRMDGIQGAVLGVKLKYLDKWNDIRRKLARQYSTRLCAVTGLSLQAERDWAESVYHLYVVRCRHRDELKDDLDQRGICCGFHYPVPLHKQPAIEKLMKCTSNLHVTSKAAKQVLSLPLYAELPGNLVDYVVEAVHSFQSEDI